MVMNRNRKIVLALGAVIIAALIVRPPYFGVDRESGGKVHAFIGYHWIWASPSSANVYERLMKSSASGVDGSRLASFEARINVVRLIQNIVILGAAVALGMAFLGRRTKGHGSARR